MHTDPLHEFKARRRWKALARRYGLDARTLQRCFWEGRRPLSLSPWDWEDIQVYRAELRKAIDYAAGVDGTDLAREVLRRERIRAHNRELAARDNQDAIARDMNVPQSVISRVVTFNQPTIQLTAEQRAEAKARYARCQYHTALAREHGAKKVCRELCIEPALRVRIIRQQDTPTKAPVVRFLTLARRGACP